MQQMEKNGQVHIHPEEQEAILTDYEICVAIVSHYLGFQDGYRFVEDLAGENCIQNILKALTPRSDAEQILKGESRHVERGGILYAIRLYIFPSNILKIPSVPCGPPMADFRNKGGLHGVWFSQEAFPDRLSPLNSPWIR